jgi:hypothetical protein
MIADNYLNTLWLYLYQGDQPYKHLVKYPVLHGHNPEELLDSRLQGKQRCEEKESWKRGKISQGRDFFSCRREDETFSRYQLKKKRMTAAYN